MEVHSIYTDFRKAFDVVPHNLLLLKMKCFFGIDKISLKFFESYLQERYQRVVISGVGSDWTHVTSGDPQGSILGPLMFIMYINDLPSVCQHSKIFMYADDAKLSK